MEREVPVVWTVAGSDSGGGAGIQADLRAFDAFEVHGCSAVAALTAQNSVAVQRIQAVSESMLDAQLAALAADMPPAAIKCGMLGSAANVRVLVAWIDQLRLRNPKLSVVVDPVLRATTGAALGDAELLSALREQLVPRATLITPNRREAAALLDVAPLHGSAAVEQSARALQALGCASVVVTGGDESASASEDYALTAYASGWLSLPRVKTKHHHGTGCVFASSAAAATARGFVDMEAIVLAKMATTHALHHAYAAGAGAGPVRPRAGFALLADNLPGFTLEGNADSSRTAVAKTLAFAPLSDPDMDLYAVVDSAAWVERMLACGIRTVQLRIKDAAQPDLRAQVRAATSAARAAGAQLFINDHWRIAIEEGAYGVHLGQEDLAIADLDAIARAGLRLGVSTHAFWEVCRAHAIRASYIACGPIHPTQAKAMPWIAQGNGNLAYWCALLPLPVVAIAGMDARRASEAMRCGAASVAVISAVTAATSPEAAALELRRAIDEGRSLPPLPAPSLPRSTLAR